MRLELFAILDEIDGRDPDERSDSYFVQIDGSGAFHFDGVIAILESLMSRTHAVAFGLRDAGTNWGMNQERKAIEKFENFLLASRHVDALTSRLGSCELPDGQAGYWGIRLDALTDISLTAHEYGLEFDLIASTLRAGIPFAFVPVVLTENRSPSNFRTADSIEKIKFIKHKLNYSISELSTVMQEYLHKHADDPTRALPQEYISSIEHLLPKKRCQSALSM